MEASDELKGEELVAAVAEMRGRQMEWSRRESLSFIWWRDADGFTRMTIPKKKGDPPQNYRPDKNIAQAWELDGEGWQWEFSERLGGVSFEFGSYAGNLLVRLWTKDDTFSYDVAVNPADFATKAQAYATARCRAYLKGMGK